MDDVLFHRFVELREELPDREFRFRLFLGGDELTYFFCYGLKL